MATRRQFIAGTSRTACRIGAVAAVMATGIAAAYRHRPLAPRERAGAPFLRPPGALEEAAFLARCIRCQRCSEVCSVGAIQLLGSEEGALHGTPFIRPEEKACAMCLRCTQACPTGALQPLEDMNEVRLGVARVDERLCVSYNGKGACGACFTACPLRGKAITQEIFNRPVVHADKCTGCGQCEEVCIVYDNKAIRVWPIAREAQVAV